MMLLKPAGLFGNYEIPFIRAVLPPLKNKGQTTDPTSPKEVA